MRHALWWGVPERICPHMRWVGEVSKSMGYSKLALEDRKHCRKGKHLHYSARQWIKLTPGQHFITLKTTLGKKTTPGPGCWCLRSVLKTTRHNLALLLWSNISLYCVPLQLVLLFILCTMKSRHSHTTIIVLGKCALKYTLKIMELLH